MTKVAIYVRVSKEEGSQNLQNPENQIPPLVEWAKKNGWDYEIIVERHSGGSDRPIFQKMLQRAYNHEFDGILVWSLDRFSREGILNTLNYIKRLKERNVWLKSLKEEWVNTELPYADLMLAQMAWFAEFERKRISDRTKAALARKKALGVKLGRPKKCPICGKSHHPRKKCKL